MSSPSNKMIDLRTPSIQYNHGGYYAPADPRDCSMPNGPCSVCADRLACMEPCPSCGIEGTYKDHSSYGYAVCRGCDPKICSECAHGARYTCAYFQAKMRETKPQPVPLERQLTEDKWKDAEEYMSAHPACSVFEVAVLGRHVYLLVRLSNGRVLRIHTIDEIS